MKKKYSNGKSTASETGGLGSRASSSLPAWAVPDFLHQTMAVIDGSELLQIINLLKFGKGQ